MVYIVVSMMVSPKDLAFETPLVLDTCRLRITLLLPHKHTHIVWRFNLIFANSFCILIFYLSFFSSAVVWLPAAKGRMAHEKYVFVLSIYLKFNLNVRIYIIDNENNYLSTQYNH